MSSNFERIKTIIAEALYCNPTAVTREASLVKDLGAESIDFLDIIFRLEKEFNIKLARGEIERRARGSLTEEEFAVDGKLSKKAMAQLRKVMPEAPAAALAAETMMMRDIPSLFTVSTFEKLVFEQLFGTPPEVNVDGTLRPFELGA